MTTASGKYYIIEAETLEARKRHRILIEEALKQSDISPELRTELEYELKRAWLKETAAQQAVDEEDAEKKKKDESDGGDGGDQQGSSGGSGSGGESSGSSGDEGTADGGITDSEMFALLFFLLEKDITSSDNAQTADYSTLAPLAAATLLFNRQEKIAHVDEPYMPERGDNPHAPSELLSSLEQHALGLGAQAMHLKVHADAVDLFRKKFGYEPFGNAVKRSGTSMQRMRKTLILAQAAKKSVI